MICVVDLYSENLNTSIGSSNTLLRFGQSKVIIIVVKIRHYSVE